MVVTARRAKISVDMFLHTNTHTCMHTKRLFDKGTRKISQTLLYDITLS